MENNHGLHLTIRYRGGDADRHHVQLRKLGESLIGLERLVSVGLYVVEVGKFPSSRQRLRYVVQATQPQAGSVEIGALMEQAYWMGPLFQELYMTGLSDIIWQWISGIMNTFGGRGQEGERRLIAFLERVNDTRHEEVMGIFDLLERILPLAHAAKQSVSPVGRSCENMSISNGSGSNMEVDVPMADAIREKGKVEVSDMTEVRISVDGFTHHNRQLKVLCPDDPYRYITAEVRDPAFDQTPNIYTDAAANKGFLDVKAKITLKDGRVVRLYVMDAKPV